MNGVKAAAIYARICSDQDGTGLGVQRQVEDCRALAESHTWTGQTHGGANRPFGYESDAITINTVEAAIIRQRAQRSSGMRYLGGRRL